MQDDEEIQLKAATPGDAEKWQEALDLVVAGNDIEGRAEK
jgi:hypothetical protein